jgi:hypothetical protein
MLEEPGLISRALEHLAGFVFLFLRNTVPDNLALECCSRRTTDVALPRQREFRTSELRKFGCENRCF